MTLKRVAEYMGLASGQSIARGTKSEKIAFLYRWFALLVGAFIGSIVYDYNDTSARFARVGYGVIGFVIPFALLLAAGTLVAHWRRQK